MGATDIPGRLAASIFASGPISPIFSTHYDVPKGGVLLAIPALLAAGLLDHHEKHFELPNGFYSLDSIFLLLAFMALCRVKYMENLRYQSPGEWGNLLGLDRIPEVKTLREKVKTLSETGEPRQWSADLSAQWMAMDPDMAGVLYIDGHVRVYHGKQTELPRHYVSRQKLCHRATMDFWVNAMDGQPFFLVNKAIDPGLIKVLENEIVPRLLLDVPNQPGIFELENDPYASRFTMVFDREGYSPDFMKRMYLIGIACQTYHKYPGEDWPKEEFHETIIQLANGNKVKMELAERGCFLGKKIWVREIRKISKGGKQLSIISTDYKREFDLVAVAMFARWSQENFFRYMRQHFNIDALTSYSLDEIDDTELIVNPLYRDVDSEVRKQVGKLSRKKLELSNITLKEIDPEEVEEYQQNKGELLDEITELSEEVEELKECRKNTPKHVTMGDLSEEDRFKQLATQSRDLIDTIKMIAYRAETTMANIVKETMRHKDESRTLLQSIYTMEADLLPDKKNKVLRVQLHNPTNKVAVKAIVNLCKELNETKAFFPGTDMRLIYDLVS
ncbi:MAG: putative transposase [Desulfobacterales bacterium]